MQAREPEPEPHPGGLGRLFRTLAPLGPGRVLARALRPARARWRGVAHAAGAGPGPLSWRGIALPLWPAHEDTFEPPGRFRFLGVLRDLGPGPTWEAPAPRLWTYHLHYLDGLRQAAIPAPARTRLLEAWVQGNPPGKGPGWEPYPTALRLVNALSFLASSKETPPRVLLDSLALQAWWLQGTLEWDVGANHLWKDALALSWSGRLLAGPRARRWRAVGDALVRRELRAQLLPDGFHAERTPTYHALLVEDLLRLDALLSACGEEGEPLAVEVAEALARTASALAAVLHPDGEVALLNDSAFGQAPRGDTLVAAASARLGRAVTPPREGLPAAGILRLASADALLFFDVGETGDRRQPGHAHADTLTIELSMSGRRVIVDAGVHDYEDSEARRYARRTAAHNTVSVDGADQSEMWGVFRVGRRARPLGVEGGASPRPWASGAHDGYRVLPGAPLHRRRVEVLEGERWRIADEVTGTGRHRVRASLRLHPDLEARPLDGGAVAVHGPGLRLRVVPETGPPLHVEEGWYFPRMGERHRCAVLVQEVEADLPVLLACRIERP